MNAFGYQLPGKKHFARPHSCRNLAVLSWRKLAIPKVKPQSTIRADPLSTRYRGTLC